MKVCIGLSGGVDSSVAAHLLLEKGYELIGCTMRTFDTERAEKEREDAEAVAESLGIPFYVVDYRERFKKDVIEYFAYEYTHGRTPNPCIICNRKVKWEALMACAAEHGAEMVATGHYARIEKDAATGRYAVRKAVTAAKDQSYALYNLKQEQLAATVFPVGGFSKDEIRSTAEKIGLFTADKPDSQEICFIPDKDYAGFISEQLKIKTDIPGNYVDEKGKPYKTAGKIDYVSGWYFKAAQLMQGTSICTAFVSTNSITQGEQVAGVWKPLYDRFNIHIDFAYRTFRWDSEASIKAHVHCVIVGFSESTNRNLRLLYAGDQVEKVENINAYLLAAPNIFIESRSKPICNIPKMIYGNKPVDGGNLIVENEELSEFIEKEPAARPYIKQLIGAHEFINGKLRWCLWLKEVSPAKLRSMPLVLERINKVKEMRKSSRDEGARKLAMTPTTFRETNNPKSAIVIPCHSSENRRYVPMGFIDDSIIVTNAMLFIPNAKLYHFGILTSNVHMSWMRAVCGRIKSDYRYSKDVVYNNFPWPNPTEEQKAKIERTAQAILDARALYPDSSLADLYDELTMPPELRKAHQNNDRAVMQAYGIPVRGTTESSCVAMLMEMYQKLVEKDR